MSALVIDTLTLVATVGATVGAAMVSGLFFIFSNTVLPALAARPDADGAAGMRAINAVILNPVFLALFFGTGIVSIIAAGGGMLNGLGMLDGGGWADALRGMATLFYLGGGIAITGVRNVPLNNRLRDVETGGAAEAAVWSDYQAQWRRWNSRRALCCLAASLSAGASLIV
jgi:uncharacterized membrane protein